MTKKDRSTISSCESVEKRRSAVRKILAAGSLTAGAGATWRTPLVDSVVLPAHAQTSESGSSGSSGILVLGGQIGEPGTTTGLLDLFLRSAYAQENESDLVGGCIEVTIDGSSVTVTVTLNNGVSDSGSGPLTDCGFSVAGVNGYTVQGTLDDADNPTIAQGSVGSEGYTAVINGSCSVIEPETTTTPTTEAPPCSENCDP